VEEEDSVEALGREGRKEGRKEGKKKGRKEGRNWLGLRMVRL
jgi:flagellar biosynthesis/type III secretory pathway protein FliH